jgi:hypothetical protein
MRSTRVSVAILNTGCSLSRTRTVTSSHPQTKCTRVFTRIVAWHRPCTLQAGYCLHDAAISRASSQSIAAELVVSNLTGYAVSGCKPIFCSDFTLAVHIRVAITRCMTSRSLPFDVPAARRPGAVADGVLWPTMASMQKDLHDMRFCSDVASAVLTWTT